MNSKKKQVWLETGYQLVAEKGFENLNIGVLARTMDKNKSSFYHYYGDWEGFEEALLAYHLELAIPFSKKVRDCEDVVPGLINVFLEHKTDLFFHKQLRINRSKPHIKRCYQLAYDQFVEAVHDQWVAFLGLERQSFLAIKFLDLIIDNLLLQINNEHYNYNWLHEYIIGHAKFLSDIKASAKEN
ncbi:MAG: TetR/AcrR family transcriptional regulator [Bacteroidota bacterium]